MAEWQADTDELNFTLRLPRTAAGNVKLALSWQNAIATCEGEPLAFTLDDAGVYTIPVVVNGFARIKICKA